MITIEFDQAYSINPDSGRDISIQLSGGENPNAWFVQPVEFSPVTAGDFIGSIDAGSPVNFYNVFFNPHGNGTHTETVRHIWKDGPFIRDRVLRPFYKAKLISIIPSQLPSSNGHMEEGDYVIMKAEITSLISEGDKVEALIIRTLPNNQEKRTKRYSGTNPCYFHPDAVEYIVQCGVEHLVVDLPSIDREEDGGELLSHHAFWSHPDNTNDNRTITELAFIENDISDGFYAINFQVAPFGLDAAPSRPMIFSLL